MGIVKRALKRENDGTPIGVPGKLYLDCECGHHLSMPDGKRLVQCPCGIEYNDLGWIVRRSQGR